MPSALQQSRDILASGVARVRSGISEYARRQSEPGPEIEVRPFDAQNVSTPAALLKLGTTIAAARRKQANLEAARSGIELEREKTRAEIARLRAQAEADLRVPAAPAPSVITPYQERSLSLRERAIKAAEIRASQSGQAKPPSEGTLRGRQSAEARAITMRSEAEGIRQSRTFDTLFSLAESPDKTVSQAALKALGIDPTLGYGEEFVDEKTGKKVVTRDAPWYRGAVQKELAGARQKMVARVRDQVTADAKVQAANVVQQAGRGGSPDGVLETGDNPLNLELLDEE